MHTVPAGPAGKLFRVIVRQVREGPIHPKPEGTTTPAEVLESCGLDVAEFYALLAQLSEHGLVQVSGEYPFEEIRLIDER